MNSIGYTRVPYAWTMYLHTAGAIIEAPVCHWDRTEPAAWADDGVLVARHHVQDSREHSAKYKALVAALTAGHNLVVMQNSVRTPSGAMAKESYKGVYLVRNVRPAADGNGYTFEVLRMVGRVGTCLSTRPCPAKEVSHG